MLLLFWLNAVNADIISVKQRLIRLFSGSTPLTPLFVPFNFVNAAISPVTRR